MSHTPWKYRCPEGHATIKKRSRRPWYRCRSCRLTYYGEPYDAREVDEFPVDGHHPTVHDPEPDEVLGRVVDVCDSPNRSWMRMDELGGKYMNKNAKVLGDLERRGLVSRRGLSESAMELWKPTDDGRDNVYGGDDT